ncbi:MAG: universal stress protein [Verrucomicrobia bacterium]|nr:universal stress protein [Verrucomicrobiota bacterium]
MKKSASCQVSRILCAVDFSELSNIALKYAAVGASAYGARLTVCHAECFELPPYFTRSQMEELSREATDMRHGAEAFLRQHTQNVLGRLAKEIPLTYSVTETHPVDGILAVARHQRADVIVLGTHGRGGAKRLWLGSVAENVVRHADVPVFVARQKQHEFIDPAHPKSAPGLRTILCPVSMNESGRSTLRIAVSIAGRFRARLVVMRVVEPGDRQTLAGVQAALRSWVGDTVKISRSTEMITCEGRVAEEIVALADQARADLVVLGAQPRHSLTTWLWGGTTDLLLRHAPAPVLVVPCRKRPERPPARPA